MYLCAYCQLVDLHNLRCFSFPSFDQAIEWFELPEAAKYINTEEGGGGVTRSFAGDTPSIATTSACRSPTETPGGVGGCGLPESLSFVNSCAQREVQDALKDLEITKQVSRRHGGYGSRSGASSVLSAHQTSTDSGVGESWGSVGVGSNRPPASNERLQAYIRKQSQLSQTMPEREVQAQAAAIALISNSPHPETLNPHVSLANQPPERGRGNMYRPKQYNSQSTDDSSSCVTMTSMSSQSELFIPRRVPNTYSDQDDQSSIHHMPRYLSFVVG